MSFPMEYGPCIDFFKTPFLLSMFSSTKIEGAVVKITSANQEALVSMTRSMYDSEGCGICEKQGAEVFWFSPYSRGAHAKCFKSIESAESHLIKTIDGLFPNTTNYGNQNNAHIKAVNAVRTACGSDTILSYLEKNGEGALAHLFNTVGVEAARRYVSSKL